MTRSLLITGARAPVALDFARSAVAAGHAVWLADSVTPFAVKWSALGSSRVIRLPAARFAFAAYRDALSVWLRAHPDGMIVPTCEEVFYLAAAAAQAGFADRLFAPGLDVLRRLHSKIEFAAWARSLGIEAPPTVAVTSRQQALELAGERDPHWVLKAEFSRFGATTLIRPRMSELRRLHASAEARWAVQDFVAGDEICLWTAARDGRIVATAAYRPRWRLGSSAAFAFEAIDCPAALEVARTIAAAARLTGQLSFDIIVRPDGQAVPIECNPRAVSGVHLFNGDPRLALALLGEGPPVHVRRGLAYLGPAMLLLGAPQALARGQTGRWLADLRRGKDALSACGRGTPVGALLDAARFAGVGLTRRRSPTRQSTDDIEWNGEPIG
jgi:hypothetical protein